MVNPHPPRQVRSHDALLRRIVGPSGLLADRYRPVEVLGQGGMGVVFSAVDERLGRDVAIKSLRPDLAGDRDFVARFAGEGAALARIHHPNVVQIIDVAEGAGGIAFYVMELVHGTALSQLIRERTRLPWAQAYDVLSQAAAALATVHRCGVVHRDVKPSNLLCTEIGRESWHVKLIDFGIALSTGAPRLTRPGETLGTLPYMAPEQFAGIGIDRRTDVYGWGVLALELLGGESPAKLFGVESLAGAPLRDAAPNVLERAGVRPHIVAIVQRCLAAQPDERYSDMDAVYDELRERDDGGALTLIFQRVPLEVPRGATLVPQQFDAPDGMMRPDVADEATRPTSSSQYPTVSDRDDAATSVQRRTPTPRSVAPAVIAAVLLAVMVVSGLGWAAHRRGWLRPPPSQLGLAFGGWPELAPPPAAPPEPPRRPSSPASGTATSDAHEVAATPAPAPTPLPAASRKRAAPTAPSDEGAAPTTEAPEASTLPAPPLEHEPSRGPGPKELKDPFAGH